MKHKLNAFVKLVQIFVSFFKPKTLRMTYNYLLESQRCMAKLDEIEAMPDSTEKESEDCRYRRLFWEIQSDIVGTLSRCTL